MERHNNPSPDIPKWSALLVEAVNKPGMIMQAYSAFHNYSIGNQILALVQCQLRGLEPGPINTFPGWQALGRNVEARRACLDSLHADHPQGARRRSTGERRRERGTNVYQFHA